jgi:hypothetical protein
MPFNTIHGDSIDSLEYWPRCWTFGLLLLPVHAHVCGDLKVGGCKWKNHVNCHVIFPRASPRGVLLTPDLLWPKTTDGPK